VRVIISEIDEPNEVAGRLRSMWFASVAEIADIDLQSSNWVDPTNTNPHWSYIEFVCSYPDSDQLTDSRARRWLAARQFNILSDLCNTILSHSAPLGDDHDNAAILDDPAWLEVVSCAQRAREELLSIVTNEAERDAPLGGNKAGV
jgi:hypothetical protein